MKRVLSVALVLGALLLLVWREPNARIALVRQFWEAGAQGTPSLGLARKLGREMSPGAQARRFPDDPWWQLQAIEAPPPSDGSDNEAFTVAGNSAATALSLDALCARFPRETWLRVEQLRSLTQLIGNERRPRPTHAPTRFMPPGAAPLTTPFPAPTPTPRVLSARDGASLRDGLAIAARGVQTESQNAFWEWMRAYFLWQLARDAEALQALNRAARLPSFNTHALDLSHAKARAQARLRPLDWDEKGALSWDNFYTLQRKIGLVTSLSAEAAERLERTGRDREALQIYDALTRALRTRRRAATWMGDVSMATRDEEIAWGGNGRSALTGVSRSSPGTLARSRAAAARAGVLFLTPASLLANYASRHGRRDLARLLLREDNEAFASRMTTRWRWNSLYGLSDREFNQVLLGSWLGGALAWQIAAGLSAWLGCMVLLGIARLWQKRKKAEPAEGAPEAGPSGLLPWHFLLLAALLPFCAIGALFVYLVRLIVDPRGGFYLFISFGSDDSRAALAALVFVGVALFPVAVALALALCGAWRVPHSAKPPEGDDAASVPDASRDDEPHDSLRWLPLSPRIMRLVLWPFNAILTWGTPLSWLALAVVGDTSAVALPLFYLPGTTEAALSIGAPSWGLSICLSLGCIARFVFRRVLRLRRETEAAPAARNAKGPNAPGTKAKREKRAQRSVVPLWRAWRDASGVALLVSALAWVALCWWSLPLRTRASSRADTVLRVGEIKALQILPPVSR